MAVSTIDALYNGTSEKLTTSATGITVTGTVAATAYTGDGSALTGTGSPSIDDNGNATALTIDSSENVLIGKTSAGYNVDGFEAHQNGETYVSRSGTPMAINRNSSHGTALNFYKDGAGVGDIGSDNGRLYIQSSGGGNLAGIGFSRTDVAVEPRKNNAFSDAEVDVGSSTYRFRDAYLSGGIQFDANGEFLAAYEEGTFTAGVSEGTIGGGDGVYVKVGDMVYVGVTIGNFSNTSSGNAIRVTGLPFTTHSTNHGSNGSVFCRYISGGFPDATQVDTSATTARIWKSGSTGWASVNYNDITSGTNAYFFISLTYRAA